MSQESISHPQNTQFAMTPRPFSEQDHAIMAAYLPLVDALAALVGPFCEVVLHSLEEPVPRIVAIANNANSGRLAGMALHPNALPILEKAYLGQGQPDIHLVLGLREQRLKGVTVAVRNGEKVLGFLGVNLNLDAGLNTLAEVFSTAEFPAQTLPRHSLDAERLIGDALPRAQKLSASAPGVNKKNRNKFIVHQLCGAGVFQVRGVAELVAERMKISIDTVYMHIRSYDRKS